MIVIPYVDGDPDEDLMFFVRESHARKSHGKCSYCHEEIKPGHAYIRFSGPGGYCVKWHSLCHYEEGWYG